MEIISGNIVGKYLIVERSHSQLLINFFSRKMFWLLLLRLTSIFRVTWNKIVEFIGTLSEINFGSSNDVQIFCIIWSPGDSKKRKQVECSLRFLVTNKVRVIFRATIRGDGFIIVIQEHIFIWMRALSRYTKYVRANINIGYRFTRFNFTLYTTHIKSYIFLE